MSDTVTMMAFLSPFLDLIVDICETVLQMFHVSLLAADVGAVLTEILL